MSSTGPTAFLPGNSAASVVSSSSRGFALLRIPMAQCIFRVCKLNDKSPTKCVARSVQHLCISAACADADSVPLCTRSTSFGKSQQAPESHGSRDGKVLTCKHNQIVNENKETTFGRICHKRTARNYIILALWGEKKKSSLTRTSLGTHTLPETDLFRMRRLCTRTLSFQASGQDAARETNTTLKTNTL